MPRAPEAGIEADEFRSLNGGYLKDRRSPPDEGSLVWRKLGAAYGRRVGLERLFDSAEAGEVDDTRLEEALIALGVYLHDHHVERLKRITQDQDVVGRVLAEQGERHPDTPQHHLRAGPALDIAIHPNKDSPWPFSRWKEMAEFSEYEYADGCVRFRGMLLRPGDVILANLNLDSNVVFSAPIDPQSGFPHSGLLAILDEGDRRIPVVIETYEKGVRPVPLSVFFNPRFIAYAEVYRHCRMTDDHRAGVSGVAMEIVRRAHGYNFNSMDTDRDYLGCTTLMKVIYEGVGAPPVVPRGGIRHAIVRENMTDLGFVETDVQSPVDFILDTDFECIGVVDNNQLERMWARELVGLHFRRRFESGYRNPGRVPLLYHVNHWAIGHLRRRGILSPLIALAAGFNHLSLPKGPARLMALLGLTEAELTKSVRKLVPLLRSRLDESSAPDFEAMLADPEVVDRLTRTLKVRWLEPRSG